MQLDCKLLASYKQIKTPDAFRIRGFVESVLSFDEALDIGAGTDARLRCPALDGLRRRRAQTVADRYLALILGNRAKDRLIILAAQVFLRKVKLFLVFI